MTERRWVRGVVAVLLAAWGAVQLSAQSSTVPGAPSIRVASATPGGALVTFTPPGAQGPVVVGYDYRAVPLRGASLRTVEGTLTSTVAPLVIPGLTNGTVYQVQIRARSASGPGAWSSSSNTFTPSAFSIAPLDPSMTYVLPTWSGLNGGVSTVGGGSGTTTAAELATRLRTEVGEGPKARIGLSVFIFLNMQSWTVSPTDRPAIEAQLATTMNQIDAAIAQARTASPPIPIAISLLSTVREEMDNVERGAALADQRNIQWLSDQSRATGWMTFSTYARSMRQMKEAYIRTFGQLMAQRMAQYPDVMVAITGDGEVEMAYDRYRSPDNPVNPSDRAWADYSPFAVAEFRDWIRGAGAYAEGQPLAAEAYRLAARYRLDPSPDRKATGVTGNTFNEDFGTTFTSWQLKHHDWSLSDAEATGAIRSATGSQTSCATGFTLVAGYCTRDGGFDAPRPDPATILANDTPFWRLFVQFRREMVHRYNRDFARWVTEGLAAIETPGLTGLTDPLRAGVPFDRWYSAQIPTDVLFGDPAADQGIRLLTSGSPLWTADIWPFGGMGATSYNTNRNGDATSGISGNAAGYYDRTTINVAPMVRARLAGRSTRWAVVEWNPSAPWSTCPDIYRADVHVLRQYRPSLVIPFKIDADEGEHRVLNSGFVPALREFMVGADAQASPANCGRPQTEPYVSHPGIAQPSGQSRGGWQPILTWAAPAPLTGGTGLTADHLNAVANLPGQFTYNPGLGTVLPAGVHTLTATFVPDDLDYAIATTTTSLRVLQSPGAVTGVVTGGGVPLSGALVEAFAVFYNGDAPVRSTTTGGTGAFTLSGLAPGTYVIRVSRTGYVAEVYAAGATGLTCAAPDSRVCPSVAGVVVRAGETVSGVQVALSRTLTLKGRVRTSDGTRVAGARIVVTGSAQRAEAVTDEDGRFEIGGLYPQRAGAHTVQAFGPAGYGLSRVIEVALRAGVLPAEAEFELTPGGAIAGTVRATTGALLAGVTVEVVTDRERRVARATTGSDGTYRTEGVPAGRYYVRTTSNPQGYVNQVYPGVPCRDCAVAAGTAVAVSGTGTTSGIDFLLDAGFRITGTVTDLALQPIPGISVEAVTRENEVIAVALTTTSGDFELTGLAAGGYWIRTANRLRYVDRMYRAGQVGGVPCLGCGPSSGTRVDVSDRVTPPSIRFALATGGAIGGTVTGDAGVPLAGASVLLFSASNELVETMTTNSRGEYASTVGLADGKYYVRTRNGLGYTDVLYDGFTCVTCRPNEGHPVEIGSVRQVTGINFALRRGARVQGRVVDASGAGVADIRVEVLATDSPTVIARATTTTDGRYVTDPVPAGTYRAVARSGNAHTRQYYCSSTPGACPSGPGATFIVSADTDTLGVDFLMQSAGAISGRVLADGVGIEGVIVEVFSREGEQVPVAQATTDLAGRYVTTGLPTGRYYLRTTNTLGYIDVVYPNVDDPRQDPRSGRAVSVDAAGVSDVDFSLVAGGRIAGGVTDGTAPIPGAVVSIYSERSESRAIASAVANPDGSYVTTRALPAGRYFALASSPGYLTSRYDGGECLACAPQAGTPIVVTAGATTSAVNFRLSSGGQITGRIVSSTGVPLPRVTVEFYDASRPGGRRVLETQTDAAGRFGGTQALPSGRSYYVRTRNDDGLIDRVYPAIECGACLLTAGTAVQVQAGGVVELSDITLARGGGIEGSVISTATRLGLEQVIVEIYRRGESAPVQQIRTNELGQYRTSAGLTAGTYLVRTRNSLGLVDEVYDNVECMPCDVQVRGTGVTVATAVVGGVSFSLATRTGSIAGRVTVDGQPATGATVTLYAAAGAEVATTPVDLDGAYLFQGLAAGTYYARMQGSGLVGSVVYAGRSGTDPVTSGTPIVVAANAAVTGRDFAVVLSQESRGLVTLAMNVPTTSLVGIYQSGQLVRCVSWSVGTESLDVALPPGIYTLSLGCNSVAARLTAFDAALASITVTNGQSTRVVFDTPTCTPPTIATTSLAGGEAGVPYSQQVTATGGTGVVRFSVFGGYLAPGLTLDPSTGAITGTPTAGGDASFTVAATDGVGCTTTQPLSIAIVSRDPVAGTVSPRALRFVATRNATTGALVAVTNVQTLAVSFASGTAPTWTVSANQSWIQLSQSSGTGGAIVQVSIANPQNVIGSQTQLSGTITFTGAQIANGPLTVPVTLTVESTTATTAAPVGFLDTPVHGSTVSGSIAVTGWALDDVGINRVEIWRDRIEGDPAPPFLENGHPANGKVFIANGTFVEGTRPDIEATYSAYPANHRAGWGYLLLTWGFPNSNGTFVLTAIAWDQEGKHSVLGTKTITVNNATATKPFGSIDVPAYGATFSGNNYTFGWALTPATGCTVSGGPRAMTIDSVPAADSTLFGITYGSPRTDISASFPGFSDSLAAGGAAALDSRRYANGTYQIGWVVYDSCGNGEGIGSRFFTILNSGSDAGVPRTEVRGVLRSTASSPRTEVRGLQPSPGESLVIRGRGPTFARVGEVVGTASSPRTEVRGLLRSTDLREMALSSQEPRDFSPGGPLWLVRGLGEVERPIAPGATVWLTQTGRIEIHATRPGVAPLPGVEYEGYLVANGVLRSLPLGSSFDARTGSFYWQPVAGFFGQYTLRIDQRRGTTVEQTWDVPIEVGPEGDASLLQIDRAACSTESCLLQGWALDPQSADSAGIGHVHVWAQKTSGTGFGGDVAKTVPDVFLGAAELGVTRPDVAQRYGAQFGSAGYSLSVPALAKGEWLVTVYAWSVRTGRWDIAKQMVVTSDR